jgi:hypothetical protein
MGSDGRFTGNRTDAWRVSSQTEVWIAINSSDQYELQWMDLTAPGIATFTTTPETIDKWPANILPNFQLSIDAGVITFTLDSVSAEGPLFTCMP